MNHNITISYNKQNFTNEWMKICTKLLGVGGTISSDLNSVEISQNHLLNVLTNGFQPLNVSNSKTDQETLNIHPELNPTIYSKSTLSFSSPITFNQSAVVNIASTDIPDELLLVASLGEKFVPPIAFDKDRVLLDLTKIQNRQKSDPFLFHQTTKLVQDYNERPLTPIQQHIKHIFNISKSYLSNNPNILVSSADKGNISVIFERNFYDRKMKEHLSNSDVYQMVNTSSHLGQIKKNKILLSKLAQSGFLGKQIIHFIVAKETQFPLIYGQWKAHKNFNLRPIMACNNVIGSKIFDIIVDILNKLDKDNPYLIKNTSTLIKELKATKLKPHDKLFSIDVVSMFTNIQPELALEIILPHVHQVTTLSTDLFREAFLFVTKHATEFQYGGHTYKQISGLPMGAKGSPVIASIVLTHIFNNTLSKHDQVTFFKKYVDDTIFITSEQNASAILQTLNQFDPRIKFTIENENNLGHINFLDVTLIRNPDLSITTKWFCKPFSSNRLVNWYSEHEPHTIRNTAVRMMGNMLSYSDPCFHVEVRQFAKSILAKNSFPSETFDDFITKAMEIVAFNLIGDNDAENTQFLSTLAPMPLLKAINACSKNNNCNVKYVNTFRTQNNSFFTFSQLKDSPDMELLSNIVVRVSCKHCKFFRITPIITPLILYRALDLSTLFHPYNSMYNHQSQSNHHGLKTKIEKHCTTLKETLRYTEHLCKKYKIPTPGNAIGQIDKHLLSYMT